MKKAKRKAAEPDVEFWQPDADAPLIGRVMSNRGRKHFFPGTEKGKTAEPIVKDDEALSETIGAAVDKGLIVSLKAANGRAGIVARNKDGVLVVNDPDAGASERPTFTSRSEEIILAANELVASDPATRIEPARRAGAGGRSPRCRLRGSGRRVPTPRAPGGSRPAADPSPRSAGSWTAGRPRREWAGVPSSALCASADTELHPSPDEGPAAPAIDTPSPPGAREPREPAEIFGSPLASGNSVAR